MTSRVPMVSPERAREIGDTLGMPERRTGSEAFRVVANNPGVARVTFAQLMQLLENNKFDTRLRELMIMRIGWVTGSAYEWTQHWRVAANAGIPPDDILAVRDWRASDRLTPADRAILTATDECLDGKSISDETRPSGGIRRCHGQLDVVLAVIPQLAHSANAGSGNLAARRRTVPQRQRIGVDRCRARSKCTCRKPKRSNCRRPPP